MADNLIIFFLLFSTLGVLKNCISKDPCFKYVKCEPKNGCGCGIENKETKYDGTSYHSRIVNGETSTIHAYPWIARVQKTTWLRRRGADNEPSITTYGGGAIITRRAILTAGHALCVKEGRENIGDGIITHITCPQRGTSMTDQQWDNARGANLNIINMNEIAVQVGTNYLFPKIITPKMNPGVQAYLYNYHPNRDLFSTNGDVGVLIMSFDLYSSLDEKTIQPICYSYGTSIRNFLEVTLAGWGIQYYQYKTSTNQLKTSCHTNYGRTGGNVQDATSFDQRFRFLDCKIPSNQQKFCHDWTVKKGIETLSANTDLSDIQTSKISVDEMYFALKANNDQKNCENYMQKALQAWRNRGERDEDFYETVDRILIKKLGEKTVRPENICYNMKKVGKHGFCLTNEPQPRHWGFCSRSCEHFPVVWDDRHTINKPYEVARFRYYENNPNSQNTLQRVHPFWVDPVLQSAFKCLAPILPKAKNAVFREINANGFLEWEENIYDTPRPDIESGHIFALKGDSGSPLWTTQTVDGKEVNNLVALISHGVKYQDEVASNTNNPDYLCVSIVAKITPEIMDWAYGKSDRS